MVAVFTSRNGMAIDEPVAGSTTANTHIGLTCSSSDATSGCSPWR